MRIPTIALAALLTAGCAAPDDGTPAADTPAASTPAPAPAPSPGSLPGTEPAPDSGTPASTTIPAAFQGTWAASAEACSGDVTHLVVQASRIEFYESVGEVLTVRTVAGDGIEVNLRLSGEGDTWEETYGFRVSDDGQTLTDTGSGLVRVRCG